MDNTRRSEIYLRDRPRLTTAQRRRLRRHQAKVDNNVVVRASRLRKNTERRSRQALRRDAVAFINAMRGGWFSPRAQRELRAAETLDALKQATANQGPKTVQDDSTVPPR